MGSIGWAGERFELHHEGAAFWRRAQTLIVADTHFGKAASFCAAGVPVPPGTTELDLARLSNLLADFSAQRLVVLGDFFHAKSGCDHATFALLESWRRTHSQLEMLIVRGNHDLRAGDPPPDWQIVCVDEPFFDGHLEFRHSAAHMEGGGGRRPVMAGHLHPCAILHDDMGSTIRARCFWFSASFAVMPAFGSFTGARPVQARRGDRIFAIDQKCLVEVKGSMRRR